MTKSDIQSILGAKTVSFNSLFAKATGSVTAAVFLSQAVFWQEKARFKNSLETIEIDGEEYFSKTGAEWYEETGLSAEQQKTARKPLVASGILKEKRAGLPAKMYFRIDIETLVSGISGYLNTGATVSGFSANRKPGNPRTGSGKFRKQEAGKSGNINNIESLESLKRGGGEATAPAENSNSTLKEETKPQINSAPPPPAAMNGSLASPFVHIGTIEPQPATIVRLYTPELPGATVIDSIPGEYQTKRGKAANRYEPNIHPENEGVFQHFTEPEKAKVVWGEWIEYKWSEHRQRYKDAKSELTALRKIWKTLGGDSERFSNAVEHSIAALYKGIFESKERIGNGQQLNKAQQQHASLAALVIQRRQAAMEREGY